MNLLNTYQNKRVIFFIDIEKKNGLGHLQRINKFSLIFGDYEKTIVSEKKIKFKNFKSIKFKTFLKKNKYYQFAVIDSYKISLDIEKQIKSKVSKVITIDDLCNRKFCSDIVLNYNPLVKEKNYKNKISKETNLLLGRNFNFLDSHENYKHKSKNFLNVFIYFGQYDRSDFIKKIILGNLNNKFIKNVFILSKYKFKFDKFNLKFKIFDNYKYVMRLMSSCDIIIISSGVILYEALSLQKLIFTYPLSENQRSHHRYIIKNNYAKDIKKIKQLKIDKFKNIVDLRKIKKKPFYRNFSSLKILKTILYGIKNKKNFFISLDLFKKNETRSIYKLQNLDYRKHFKNPKTFSFDHHKKYIDNFLEKEGNLILTIKRDIRKIIGYVKLENKNEKTCISITINQKYQNVGIATNILSYLRTEKIVKGKFFAEIKKNNIRSISAFKNAGFKINKNIKLL